MVMSRPRLGRVRKQAYDVLGNANASQLQVSKAALQLIVKASEVLDEVLDGSQITLYVMGKKIPVTINIDIKEEDE